MKTDNVANQKHPQAPASRPRRPLTPEQKRRRAAKIRKQKRFRRMMVGITVALVLLIAVMVGFLLLQGEDALKGTWTMDGVTTYAFYGGRKGAMILPTAEYEFKYTIKEDTVSIDFVYEGAKDSQYAFSVQGNTLTLTGGSAASQGTYSLTKIP